LRCAYLKKAGRALISLGKNGDAAGEPQRFFLVMCHQQRTDALVLQDLGDLSSDLVSEGAIEVGEGLVE
jgi:hypothetical protein